MSVRPDQSPRPRRCPEPLRVTHPHAAGIDIHAAIHWVAVPPGDAPPAPDHAPRLTAACAQPRRWPGAPRGGQTGIRPR